MRGVGALLSDVASVGKAIKSASISDDAFTIIFADGSGIKFYDSGQSCCESRYMNTDEDLNSFSGAKLLGASIREVYGVQGESDWNVTDCAFLVIETSKGAITIKNYNIHNGYYGGFDIRVRKAE